MEHANHVILGGRITNMPSTKPCHAEQKGISFDLDHISYNGMETVEVGIKCQVPAGFKARSFAQCFDDDNDVIVYGYLCADTGTGQPIIKVFHIRPVGG